MKTSRTDLWIGAGLLAFCALAGWITLSIPSVSTGTSAGPRFIPWLMIGLIAALSLAMIWRRPSPGPSHDGVHNDADTPGSPYRALPRIAMFTVLLVIYAAAFLTVGYLVSSIVVFMLGMVLMGERRIIPIAIVPIAIVALIYYGFTHFLGVWLP